MTPARQILIDQLVRHEGIVLKPYQDAGGKWTIGVGRNLTDVGITDKEAMVLLEHDIDDAILDLLKFSWFPGLNDVRQRAVVDFRFNVGPSTFRNFPRFIHAMAIGDFAAASNELLTSKWATQVGLRSKEIADMIRTGVE